jgi:fibrillarin-like pre-rRNA processing protein
MEKIKTKYKPNYTQTKTSTKTIKNILALKTNMRQLFEGIYSNEKGIYTKNLLPGNRVYGEKLLTEKGTEYREWDTYRSKYCAGIMKGLKQSIFSEKTNALYLGSAEGTTVSHVSDIVGENGLVLCIDISEIAMMKLNELAEKRTNIFPIVSDAQQTKNYEETIQEACNGKVDSLFQDISQRNQAEIFVKNAHFLKKGSLGAIAIKTKSISQGKEKKEVLEEEKKILEKEFEIIQTVNLEPYEKHHYMVLCKKK